MYDNEWRKISLERYIYNISQESGLTVNNGGIYDNNVNDIKLSYLLGLGLSYKDNQNIKFTSMLTRITTNRAQIYDGTDENANIQRITNLRWQERTLFFNQLTGSHQLPFRNLTLDWAFSVSKATMDIPNEVNYTYWLEQDTGKYYNRIRVPNSNLSHEFTYLEDTGQDARVDLAYKFDKVLFLKEGEFKVGLQKQTKERSSRVLRFTYLPRPGIELPEEELKYKDIDTIFSVENRSKYFRLQPRTFFNDRYSGKLDINAFYLNLDTKLSEKSGFP